jgi:hypothetical protein
MTSPRGAFSRWDWGTTAAGIALAAVILFIGGHGGAAPGAPSSFMVTVVPADAAGLGCAGGPSSAREVCGFDDEGRPTAATRPLRPFVTVRSELVLLSGVFEEDHVESWLRQALAAHSSNRVTLDCRGRFLGRSGAVKTRFAAGSPWQAQRDVTVGRVEACRVAASPP